MFFLPESFVTHCTLKRSGPSMDHHVSRQVTFLSKQLVTVGTFVELSLHPVTRDVGARVWEGCRVGHEEVTHARQLISIMDTTCTHKT